MMIREMPASFDNWNSLAPPPAAEPESKKAKGNSPPPAEPPSSTGTASGGGDKAKGDEAAAASGINSTPPLWAELGEAKKAVLTVLCKSTERLQGRGVATKAGYKEGSLRHHYGALQKWNYIDKTSDGYAITEAGKSLVPCERV